MSVWDTVSFFARISNMEDAPEGKFWGWYYSPNDGKFYWGLGTKLDPDEVDRRRTEESKLRVHRCGDDSDCPNCNPYQRNDPSDGFHRERVRSF